MAREHSISDAEWEVMNVVWERQPVSSQAVVAALADGHGWSPATIKTMLHRLTKKGVLSFNREANRYLYRAAAHREECVRRATQSFLKRVFGGETAPMLAHFVQSGQLSAQEISHLRRLLKEQEAKK